MSHFILIFFINLILCFFAGPLEIADATKLVFNLLVLSITTIKFFIFLNFLVSILYFKLYSFFLDMYFKKYISKKELYLFSYNFFFFIIFISTPSTLGCLNSFILENFYMFSDIYVFISFLLFLNSFFFYLYIFSLKILTKELKINRPKWVTFLYAGLFFMIRF